MVGREDLDNYNEAIDDFYVVDSWSEKPRYPDKFESSIGYDNHSKEDKLSRRKPTEGEIDEFLENLKQSKSKCGTSGLEGSNCNSFDSGNGNGIYIKIPEGGTRDKLCIVNNQAAKNSSQPVKRFKHSTVSYKPGETLTKTLFSETSINDLTRSINNQEIHNSSSDFVFHVSFDWNEDSGGDFSDLKGSQCANGPFKSSMESSSHQLRRGRSRSPFAVSSTRYNPVRESTRFPSREDGRNRSHLDISRTRDFMQDKRHHDDIRRHRRSRSKSRERKHLRRRSYERRISLSPSPKRGSENLNRMESRQLPPYYPSSSGAPVLPDTSFMNPNPNFVWKTRKITIIRERMAIKNIETHKSHLYNTNLIGVENEENHNNKREDGYKKYRDPQKSPLQHQPDGMPTHGPVQYPVSSVSSNSSYGRYPGFNVPGNNSFNSGPTQPNSFQPQMPQNQYPNPQNYNLYNPITQGIPPNPVSHQASWNQTPAGFNQNYSMPNVSSTDTVMYPHLKIGQTRVESYKNSQRESVDGSYPHKQIRSSLEKKIRSKSRSPDPKKGKRKASKRYSRSPSLDRKFEDSNKRYARRSKSPAKASRYDSKKPKVVIDPNRIPTPPPPPIVGSYKKEESKKSPEQKVKTVEEKSNSNTLSDFLSREKVSLSCLLEAVMETSGQGKSQLSDPKVKKEIISNCESKIQHLYKRRISGLGAFIPDPVQSTRVIAHASPLVTVYSSFTYNCEEENNEWHCPDIIVPELKYKNDIHVPVNRNTTSQLPFGSGDSHMKTSIENPTVIPTLSNNQPLAQWNANRPEHLSQSIFPTPYDNNQQNMFPSHQGQQTWSNPVPAQNPYIGQPPMTVPGNEYSSSGPPPYMQPSYPFPNRPPAPQFMPQHGYPPQPEMLNYPNRMDYPPMQPFPPQNINHPGMFNAPQPNSNRGNYQYKPDENQKLKNVIYKNKVNENLILLSHNAHRQSGVTQEDVKVINEKVKVERDLQGNKGPKDKLNFVNMIGDTQLEELTSLKERIETCLAEGKLSPGRSRHKSRDRREGDRERDRRGDRDRGRDMVRDSERHRRRSLEDERRRRRSVDKKSKDHPDKKDHSKTSSREDVIEILSDEDHNKLKLSESSKNEGSFDPEDHLKPSEKTLLSQIFDLLGPEIRKIQEKSELYRSIIDSLDKGDKAYKRIYSFRNHALMKSDKDNKMKMVIPRDDLKEVVTLIHKSFHHVQSEELSGLLKKISYPYMLYIPKCVSKVMSECFMCIEEKKKNDEPMIDQKYENIERKPGKKNDRSLRDRDRERDRRNSAERYKKSSKDRSSSSSSKGRRDPHKSGREKDKKDSVASDGRPSGYEKATKVRRSGASASAKSDKTIPDGQCLDEKSDIPIDVKSLEPLNGLSDKALEFKSISDDFEDRTSIPEGFNQNSLTGLGKSDNESSSACCEISKNDLENKGKDAEVESTDIVTNSAIESSDLVTQQVVKKQEIESLNTVTKSEKESNSVTSPEMESSITVTKSTMESSDIVTKSEMESSNTDSKPEIKALNTVTKPDIESCNIVTKSVIESCNTVTKSEIESSNQVTNPHQSKELVSSISESSDSSKVDSVDKNRKPNESSSDAAVEVNKQSNKLSEKSKENSSGEEKASLNKKVNDAESKAATKLDFKGRVRQVQMSSNECKNVLKALELNDDIVPADPSYIIKGGMLCRKDTTGNTIEVKIVVPSDELEKIINIVHTMSAIHTPPAKVVAFFTKHFTQVDNLDLKVNEIVGNCSYCKLKSS